MGRIWNHGSSASKACSGCGHPCKIKLCNSQACGLSWARSVLGENLSGVANRQVIVALVVQAVEDPDAGRRAILL